MYKLIPVLIFAFSTFLFSVDIDKNLANYLNENPGKNVKIWIFFKDKGPENKLSFSKVNEYLSERAIKRRRKIMGSTIIKFSDYPVYPNYVDQIKTHVLGLRSWSRWLNAVSATVNNDQIKRLERFDFVNRIRLMTTYKKRIEKEAGVLEKSASSSSVHSLDYGLSEPQLDQIGVIALHEKGFTGKGVYIAMLDDGFNRYKSHDVFDSLKIIDTWDFTNGDDSVDDPDGKPTGFTPQGFHGTMTLSVIGGNSPGNLIGPAFNASFLLYKTEIDSEEINIEEDHWVAGLERAEAMGADIVNSSLGYSDFDNGQTINYTWEDMDGKTAVTTLATIIAEANGLIVVNSVGNEGQGTTPNTLNAPADGEFVITVGGVRQSGEYWTTSSHGPTADGRIKPDVSARGVSVYRASYTDDTGFLTGSGTSFSSPLTAGAIALLIEAFPDITPAGIRQAIRKTASQANSPDNFIGYGILNIDAAYNYLLTNTLPGPTRSDSPSLLFRFTTKVHYGVKSLSKVKLTIYDVLGRRVHVFPEKTVDVGEFELVNGSLLKASGVYFYHIDGKNISTGKGINKSGKLFYLE